MFLLQKDYRKSRLCSNNGVIIRYGLSEAKDNLFKINSITIIGINKQFNNRFESRIEVFEQSEGNDTITLAIYSTFPKPFVKSGVKRKTFH